MKLTDFNSLIGQDSYVLCRDKERVNKAIVNVDQARKHLSNGGTIGWWVTDDYIIVDIDEGKEEVLKVVKELKLKTLMCKTPKGIHIYFKSSKQYEQKIKMVLPSGLKCDFRCANKGYVILPYNTKDRKFNKIKDIAEMPLEFTPMLHRKESLLNLKEGDGRNATLFSHLMAYKNRGASQEQIERMADIINRVVFREPMKEDELSKIIENTEKYEAKLIENNPYIIYSSKGNPSSINCRAVCDYFVSRDDIFCMAGDCYLYEGGIYKESSSFIRHSIKEMIGVDSLITHARIMECYRLLVDDIRIQKKASELNKNKNLINFRNGVWDIKKRKLKPHSPKYFQTIQIPHDYVPPDIEFKDTRLYSFLRYQVKLARDDFDMILDYIAYIMTLGYGLKTFMILQGQSNTGKSVLIRFVEKLAGLENTSNLSIKELSMRFYPSQLYNRILNSCADNSSSALKSIDSLKKITGGDSIMHEKKGKDPFFFVPFAKLLLSFNQMPLQLEEKSNAFYKRMRILKMDNELFLNDEYVDSLFSLESIEQTIPFLLDRLPLDSIRTSKQSNVLVSIVKYDSDSITAFLGDCCELTGYIERRKLYESYCMYCLDTGREPHKKHAFMRHIRSMGYKEIRKRGSKDRRYYFHGIKLSEDDKYE